jgi:hypothetical protein
MFLTDELWKSSDKGFNFPKNAGKSRRQWAKTILREHRSNSMAFLSTTTVRSTTWPITVGAEGIAAAQFARCGFDVLVQASRDKAWYDLVVSRAGNLLKISVKASDDGEWRLTSGYARSDQTIGGASFDMRNAIDRWQASYGSRTVCCLVQFCGVSIDEMPRIYLALPGEVAQMMRETASRIGRCTVCERYEWMLPDGSPKLETLPSSWRFSPYRIEELLAEHAAKLPASFGISGSNGNGAGAHESSRETMLH